MRISPPSSTRFFLGACAVHLLVFGLLFFKMTPNTQMIGGPKVLASEEEEPPIIQAATIDAAQVDAEVNRLEKEEIAKAQKEKTRLAAQEAKLKQAKAEQQKEKERLAALKKEVSALKKQVDTQKIEADKATKEVLMAKEKAAEAKKIARLAEEKRVAAEKQRKEKLLAEAKKKADAEHALQAQLEKEQKARENARLLSLYIQQIMRSVSQHWLKPMGADQALEAIVQVKVLPSGEVIQASVLRSSGDMAFDRSTEAAVLKASPLPMPQEHSVREQLRDFTFTFRPEST